MYQHFFKRLIDFLAAFFGLLVLLPFLIPVAIILSIQNRGPIFFFQERPGKDEKAFHIIKFKSMNDRKDENGNLLPDNVRLTKFGNFIRKLSIDELPQLVNVLKGDMSLVGPRPLLFKYIPLYSEEQRKRHLVRPGITGWAQVNGRNSISWAKKFAYDVEYVNNLSFLLDMKILFLTVKKVVVREGVNQSEERPMFPFDGSN
ncbi:MAG: sugar transferase [Cyclobacteriaceae bacterium]|nr:sugar transferase [Cyclobacteriaceae bacterium]MCH8518098.1 sugar transferase [Cyclobacteriaceae bacterium]